MVLIIFGSTGDLSRRMLFPSLYHLFKEGRIPEDLRIIAVGRREYDNQAFFDFLAEEFKKRYKTEFNQDSWKRFSSIIEYFLGDLGNPKDYQRLGDLLADIDGNSGQCQQKIFYLAISPDLYLQTFKGIRETSLNRACNHEDHNSVVIEKPFGKNLNNFYELNNQLLEIFDEKHIYRIDHYLGKDTVKNILYFRASNPIFFNDWSNKTIDRVEVRVLEDLGVGTRAQYYDNYGQLRDLVQSHVLQLLSLVLCSLPESLDSESVMRAKLEILKNLKVLDFEKDIIRGQYTSGVIRGDIIRGYREEDVSIANSLTETFVNIRARLDLPLWENVDINLISGKGMQEKDTSITLYFKSQEKINGISSKNKLVFQLQPREGISLDLQVKRPGSTDLDIVPMVFKYEDNFKVLLSGAYESLLLDIFNGNKSSFISTDELEASWKFVDPVLEYWKAHPDNLRFYPAGSKEIR